MPNLISSDNIYLILGFIVPGLIITFMRSQFLTGRSKPHTEALLSYFTISIVYYAPFITLVNIITGMDNGWLKTAFWISIILILPAMVGCFLGWNIQSEWTRRFLEKKACTSYTQ